MLTNRLAVVGLTIIFGMTAIAVYARVTYDFGALASSQLGTEVADRAPPGWLGPAPANQQVFGTDAAARDIYKRACTARGWH